MTPLPKKLDHIPTNIDGTTNVGVEILRQAFNALIEYLEEREKGEDLVIASWKQRHPERFEEAKGRECCDLCRKLMQDFAGSTKLGGVYPTCTDENCPCHSPKEKPTTDDWEAALQFEVMEDYLWAADRSRDVEPRAKNEERRIHFDKLKTFIRELITHKEAETLEKVRKMVEGKKKILWSDDINQHNRNIERENVLGDILKELSALT